MDVGLECCFRFCLYLLKLIVTIFYVYIDTVQTQDHPNQNETMSSVITNPACNRSISGVYPSSHIHVLSCFPPHVVRIVVYVDLVESLEFVRASLAMKNSISRRTMSGNLDAFPSVAQSQSVLVDWMLLFRLCWVGKELFCSVSSRERPARLVGSVGIDMVMIRC
jgi:hypothetical protein